MRFNVSAFLLLLLFPPASLAGDFARDLDRPEALEAFLKGGQPFGVGEPRHRSAKKDLVMGKRGVLTLDQWLIAVLTSSSYKGIRLDIPERSNISKAAARLDYLVKIHAVAAEAIKERIVMVASDVRFTRELMEWRVRFGMAVKLSLGFPSHPPEKEYSSVQLQTLRREAIYLGGAVDLRLGAEASRKTGARLVSFIKDLLETRKLTSLSVTFSGGAGPELGTFRQPLNVYME